MTSLSDAEIVNAPGGLVELGYGTRTSAMNITSTSAPGDIIIPAVTIVADGSPIDFDFFVPVARPGNAASAYMYFALYDGATPVAQNWGVVYSINGSTYEWNFPIHLRYRDTPTAGVHSYTVRAWVNTASSGYIGPGTGGASASPAFLRISKIIQASQLLVTQSNAPIVTSLPSGNLVTGQEVQLYSTSPYAGYQRQMWDGTQWNVMGDSRMSQWQSYTPVVTQSNAVTVTVQHAKYCQIGKAVFGNGWVTVTGSGTGNNNVFISLPVTSAMPNGPVLGGGYIYDASTNTSYTCQLTQGSTTTGTFVNDLGGGGSWGSGPNIALAVNDQLRFSFHYEAA